MKLDMPISTLLLFYHCSRFDTKKRPDMYRDALKYEIRKFLTSSASLLLPFLELPKRINDIKLIIGLSRQK